LRCIQYASQAGPAPWRIPFHIAIFFVPRFPEREIADVLLVVFIVLHALSIGVVTDRSARAFISWKFVDAKINRFVVGLISQTLRNQRADHLDHSVDVPLVGGFRIFVGALDAQCSRVFEECLFELFGKLSQRNGGFARATNRFVLHIGDVHDAMHL
jgi:hypothetical protein